MIKKITLEGTEVPNPREVTVRIETPSDRRGVYREPTFATVITIIRDGSEAAFVHAFGLATNEDGRKKILTSGKLEFESDSKEDNYTIDLSKYFISRWMLSHPLAPNAPTLETIELRVGDMKYNAGGEGKSFKLPEFA